MRQETAFSLPVLRVYLLGPLEVSRRDADGSWKIIEKKQWRNSRPARSVFKRLLATPGRRLSRGQLIDDVWPATDFELADKKYLYTAISVIHGIIGKDLVTTWESSYELAGQARIWVDIDACEQLCKMAENQGSERADVVPVLEEALAYLERGEYLEREDGRWRYSLQTRAEDLLKQCRLWLAEGYAQQGKTWQAGEQYRALCQMLPPDEAALPGWMAMLVHQGKRQEALRRYQEVKGFCEKQGFALSPALDAFAEQIKAQPAPALRPLLSVREEKERAGGEMPVVPEKAVLLWLPIKTSQNPSSHLTAWSLLLPEERELASSQEILYDNLETEVLTTALQWKAAMDDPLVVLQRSVHEVIGKYDVMREDLDRDAKITRRHALQNIAHFPIQMYGLAFLLSEQQILPPSEEFLPLCAASLTACQELRKYELDGMSIIHRTLATCLPTLEKLAQQSSPSRQAAAHLVGQSYLLVHVLAEYYGKPEQMEAAARRARFYGQLAQDPNLEVSALIRLAVKFDYEHRYPKALETYQEGLALPGLDRVSPLLQGRLYSGLAGMYAICQQEDSPALSFLDQAKEIWPTEPQADPSYAFAYSNRIDLGEGLALEHTKRYAEALNVYRRYGSLKPKPREEIQSRALHLSKATAVAIKQQDLDVAYLYLDAAEEIAWTTQHKQRLSEVHDTLRGMQFVWPHEPKVRKLQEKLYERQH